jgi:AcrR family transcriptional regulator
MAPKAVHAKDAILDAARGLVLERGVQHATVSAISEESGAPVGSLYHHFGSRDDLVAELWVRSDARRRLSLPPLATLTRKRPQWGPPCRFTISRVSIAMMPGCSSRSGGRTYSTILAHRDSSGLSRI